MYDLNLFMSLCPAFLVQNPNYFIIFLVKLYSYKMCVLSGCIIQFG